MKGTINEKEKKKEKRKQKREKRFGRWLSNDWQLLSLSGESSAKRGKGRIATSGQTGPRLRLPTYLSLSLSRVLSLVYIHRETRTSTCTCTHGTAVTYEWYYALRLLHTKLDLIVLSSLSENRTRTGVVAPLLEVTCPSPFLLSRRGDWAIQRSKRFFLEDAIVVIPLFGIPSFPDALGLFPKLSLAREWEAKISFWNFEGLN